MTASCSAVRPGKATCTQQIALSYLSTSSGDFTGYILHFHAEDVKTCRPVTEAHYRNGQVAPASSKLSAAPPKARPPALAASDTTGFNALSAYGLAPEAACMR